MPSAGTKQAALREISAAVAAGRHAEAFAALNAVASPEDDFVQQFRYAQLYRSLRSGVTGLKPVRIAVPATSTVTNLTDVLGYWLARQGLEAEIFVPEFNTMAQTVLDPGSDLYRFNPDIVMFFTSYRDVRCAVRPGASHEEVMRCVGEAVRETVSLWEAVRGNCSCHILQNNADIPSDRTFGNYEGSVPWSRYNVLRLYNLELAAALTPGVTLLDIDALSSFYGKRRWHDSRFWFHSRHAFALDATGIAAFEAAKVIASVRGLSKKCVVLDLDNTLWGGVIGDDGVNGIVLGHGAAGEAFVEFQRFLQSLKKRGVILAVCSKNDEENAREPFLRHPDMQLKLDDIAVFKASWDNKADSIREIASTLNIGLDSIVFVDDNPAERALVREMLPMVSVPELPEDPADYVDTLSKDDYFETVSFSEEDGRRGDYYRDNAVRSRFQKQFADLADYLKNLRMEAYVGRFNDFTLPRAVQLINKSNQFHLTTTRYTESDARVLMSDPRKHCLLFTLKDRFGDNGLISVVIIDEKDTETMVIDTWAMSCRVLSRGMEEFICREIVNLAQRQGCARVIGRYVPSKKNKLVERLFERLHFALSRDEDGTTTWELDLRNSVPEYATFIERRETHQEQYDMAVN